MDFLKVSSSPHMRHEDSTKVIMFDVLIALCPALIWAIYLFGYRALVITLVSVASSVFFEFVYRLIAKKSITVGDFSAAVTGMLLAFTLPVSVPLWVPVLGSFFAIVIVKQLYGGLGKNVVNPALAARVFLFLAFPTEMATYTKPYAKLPLFSTPDIADPDIIAGATPLANINQGDFTSLDKIDLIFGNTAGCIGEVSALLLIIGGVYLLVRKIITWHIPVSFLATVAVVSYITGADPVQSVICHLLTGGLMIGAFFMATDYVTSPVSPKGRIIYGIGCGLITMFIRLCGGYPEGVSFAILVMNCLAWYIDKFTRPKVFGGGKQNEKK